MNSNKFLAFVIIFFVVSLFLAMCAPQPSDFQQENGTNNKYCVRVANVSSTKVDRCEFPNGDVCYVSDGYYSGGIDCMFADK